MSEGSSEDDSVLSSSLNKLFPQLSSLLSLSRQDKEQTRLQEQLVDQIVEIGSRDGFTDGEATELIGLALKGGSGQTLKKRRSAKLIKSVYPAKNEQFTANLVLVIVGALGPTEDTVTDGVDNMDVVVDSDSSGDESGVVAGKRKRRRKVAIEVQALALRLLVLLLCPPPIMTTQGTLIHVARFLSVKARRTLESCYSILFHFLDYQTLRPYLCNLLCLITRRKHVRQHRLDKLLSLRRNFPADNNIETLIAAFSNFLPALQTSEVAVQRGSSSALDTGLIRFPDSAWIAHVNGIWTRAEHDEESNDDNPTHINENMPRKRRRKLISRGEREVGAFLPLVRSILPAPTSLFLPERSLMITEVLSYKALGYSFPRLQLPTQLVSALAHQMTGIALLAKRQNKMTEDTLSRISYWIMSAMSEEIQLPMSKMIAAQDVPRRSNRSHEKSCAMLLALGSFVEKTGACDSALQRWITRLLQPSIWSSFDLSEQEAILRLISMWVPDNFNVVSVQLLQPIIKLVEKSEEGNATMLINAITRLVEKWVIGRNWAAITFALEDESREVLYGSRILSPTVDYISTISQTIQIAVEESSKLLVRFPRSLNVMDANLTLYELIFTSGFLGLHPFGRPNRFPLQLLSLSQIGSLVTLSRYLTIMNQTRDLHLENGSGDLSIEDSINLNSVPDTMKENLINFLSQENRDAVNNDTTYITDLIWRDQDFSNVEDAEQRLGLLVDFFTRFSDRCTERGEDLRKIGSISHGAVLGPLMEIHANEVISRTSTITIRGPITSQALGQVQRAGVAISKFKKFRDEHLDWLGNRGATGVRDFLYVAIKRLNRLQRDESQGYTRGQSNSSSSAFPS